MKSFVTKILMILPLACGGYNPIIPDECDIDTAAIRAKCQLRYQKCETDKCISEVEKDCDDKLVEVCR